MSDQFLMNFFIAITDCPNIIYIPITESTPLVIGRPTTAVGRLQCPITNEVNPNNSPNRKTQAKTENRHMAVFCSPDQQAVLAWVFL